MGETPAPNWIVRGGYGIFYFLDRGGIGNQLSNNPDFNGTSSYQANNGYRVTFTGQAPLDGVRFADDQGAIHERSRLAARLSAPPAIGCNKA